LDAGPCRGEAVPRLCELVDPDGASYHPEYRAVLAEVEGDDPPEGADAPEPSPASESFPPLMTQAVSLAKAAGNFIASGFQTTDAAEFERRYAICKACPTGMYSAASDKCRKCGCLLKAKLRSAVERCPDGHW